MISINSINNSCSNNNQNSEDFSVVQPIARFGRHQVNLSDSQETPHQMGQNNDFTSAVIDKDPSIEDERMSIPDEYDEDPLEEVDQMNCYENDEDGENTSYLQMFVNEYYEERQQQQSSAGTGAYQQKLPSEHYLNEYDISDTKIDNSYHTKRQQQQQSIGTSSGNSYQNLQSTLGMRYNINTEEVIIEEDCETQQSQQESPTNVLFDSPLNRNSNSKKIIVKDNKHLKNKLKTLHNSGSVARTRKKKPNLFSQKRQSLDHTSDSFKLRADQLLNKSLFQEKRKSMQDVKQTKQSKVLPQPAVQQISPSLTPSTGFQTAFSNYQSSQCSRADLNSQKSKIKFHYTQDLSLQIKNHHQILTSLKSQMRIKNNQRLKNAKSFQVVSPQIINTSYLSQVIQEQKKREKDNKSHSPQRHQKNSQSVKRLKNEELALERGVDLTDKQFNLLSPSISRESTPKNDKENFNLILTDSAFKKYQQNAQAASQNQALTRLNVNLSTSNNDLSQSGQQIQNPNENDHKNVQKSMYYKLNNQNKIKRSDRSPKMNQISLDYNRKTQIAIKNHLNQSDINKSHNQSNNSSQLFNKKRHSLNISQHKGEKNIEQSSFQKRRMTQETSTMLSQTQKINTLAKKLLITHKKTLL